MASTRFDADRADHLELVLRDEARRQRAAYSVEGSRRFRLPNVGVGRDDLGRSCTARTVPSRSPAMVTACGSIRGTVEIDLLAVVIVSGDEVLDPEVQAVARPASR